MTMNTVRPPTALINIASAASPSSTSHTRNLVKGNNCDYNDSMFGLSFKNYTTHVLVALALDLNGLR